MLKKKLMKCNICGNITELLFEGLVLNKYRVKYYKCPNCEFIQTEKPYWLKEAYGNAITDLDVGLVSRNLNYSNLLAKIIEKSLEYKGKFLDYAGGYGLFVRIMRDKGLNYYREDKYCENIFAHHFDLSDLPENQQFEAITAFEVFEHLNSPLEDIEEMFRRTDTLIFSTELQPKSKLSSVDDWWYFTPETGQHISFYTNKTLKYIAEKYGLSIYSRKSLHLLSKRKFASSPLNIVDITPVNDWVESGSLTNSDFKLAKEYIKRNVETVHQSAPKLKGKAGLNDRLELAYVRLDVKEKELADINEKLLSSKVFLATMQEALNSTKSQLKSTQEQLADMSNCLVTANSELAAIYSSRGWRVLVFVRKLVIILLPHGSIRRKLAVIPFKILRKVYGSARGFRVKISEYVFIGEIALARLKPRGKRPINKGSKKIVYIGHSYHNKTKSTEFLIEYLKKFYDVTLILDESWKGEGDPFPDLSFIDESYLGVIFFQNLPSREIMNTVNNNNIIFFPMYDASSGLGYDFWRNWRDLKIMNFSKTLHKKLSKWGFESGFVQYFPKPDEFTGGDKNGVFFWQRLSFININTLTSLFGKKKLNLHLHRAIDPGQVYVQPSEEVEKRYNITYSDWFETPAEMKKQLGSLIKEKGIYVAPREYEGIGMSFLEAMAMGKAVVAVNNPTMNEYIVDGKTGYLFDLSKPKEIDITNIEEVQKNTYKYMCDGYEKWQKDIHKIIEFIEK